LRVVVLGPGAIGRALGATLGAGGADVVFAGRAGPEGPVDDADLVLVTVKSRDTAAAIAGLAPLLGPRAAVISLQNGLGNVERIAEAVGPERSFGGSTTHGARRLSSGEVLHTAKGETRIAPCRRADVERAREIAWALSRCGVSCTAEEDLSALLWRKLAVSCGLNAVTGIFGIENGEVLRSEAAKTVVVDAAREVGRAAERYGIVLGFDPGERALEVAAKTARNRSSLLQDLEAGRPTEIDAINGAAVERGAKVGIDMAVNRTLLLLVRAREQWRAKA
jgi:2-dehydropantoate 2-reductase